VTARSSTRIPFPPGLDYPGIGPEHSWLHEMKRVN
jgi:tryptophan synthase beta subunit